MGGGFEEKYLHTDRMQRLRSTRLKLSNNWRNLNIKRISGGSEEKLDHLIFQTAFIFFSQLFFLTNILLFEGRTTKVKRRSYISFFCCMDEVQQVNHSKRLIYACVKDVKGPILRKNRFAGVFKQYYVTLAC